MLANKWHGIFHSGLGYSSRCSRRPALWVPVWPLQALFCGRADLGRLGHARGELNALRL